MRKINKHIEIVRSSVKSQSSMSNESYEKIHIELAKYYNKVGLTIVNTENDLEQILEKKPDVVFLGMKKVPKKTSDSSIKNFIWLSDYLENANIPYTGSKSSATEIEENKNVAKNLVRKANLDTANHFMAYTGQYTTESQVPLNYPLFVKPPNLGGGTGIDDGSVVRSFKEYKDRIKYLDKKYNSEALVEEYLTGREFTVAILKKQSGDDFYTMPLEMIAIPGKNGVQILGSKVKSDDSESVRLIQDKEIKSKISDLAIDIFELIEARDYGRVDIRMNSDGIPQFMEVNLIPSLIKNYGNFQKACEKVSGISYKDMLLMIVELALNREKIELEAAEKLANLEIATI